MKIIRRPDPAYAKLLEHEFETPEDYRARMNQNLGAILEFAARAVPHYRQLFRKAGADLDDSDPMRTLAALPLMTKLGVVEAGRTLLAENLPPDGGRARWWESSGTTGRPVRILHSRQSMRMYSLLTQRTARWYRLDPSATFADMRIPRLLPRHPDGRELAAGEVRRLDHWRDMGDFATGPYIGISVMTPIEQRIAWLRRECPAYLMAYSETLELLAMATGDERPADSLKAVVAISEQLTPSMRSYVERRFRTPVHQTYGLSEFGHAAVRCDAGRYHAHREHCLIEIVDEEGRPCAPGETGKIVITGLSNFAMPLIRYDTGDLAEAADGPCPCNRTLPSFGEIVGRYSRTAYLPAGTIGPVLALRGTIETMPANIMQGLREFQIHQYADKRMELRLVTRGTLADAFFERVRAEWTKATGGNGAELSVVFVDEIRKSGGKSEVFTSDFMPARDGKTPAAASKAGPPSTS